MYIYNDKGFRPTFTQLGVGTALALSGTTSGTLFTKTLGTGGYGFIRQVDLSIFRTGAGAGFGYVELFVRITRLAVPIYAACHIRLNNTETQDKIVVNQDLNIQAQVGDIISIMYNTNNANPTYDIIGYLNTEHI